MSHPPPPGPLNPWVCPQEGMLQHWELGQALRQRYHGFLNTSYHRQEVRLGTLEGAGIGCSHSLPSGRLPVTRALWPSSMHLWLQLQDETSTGCLEQNSGG